MRAVMLAAGVGRRLRLDDPSPKILLSFAGETLLARHLRILGRCGIECIDLVIGYRGEEVVAEIERLGAGGRVVTHVNRDFEDGPVVSLWTAVPALSSGEAVVFMDADVLYDHRILARLAASPHANCFLMDREVEEGEDPVKLCMADGLLVDFHKRPKVPHEWWGEWIGFARFGPEVAAEIARTAERYIASGRRDAIYEDVFRDVLLAAPPGAFAVEDVTGLPWVEIDFPEDLEKARSEILPRLEDTPG
jgi:choline kinase